IYYTGSIYYEGTSGHKYVMYVTNQNGDYLSQHLYNGNDSSQSGGADIVLDSFENLICTGSYNDTGNICMTIKYDALTFEKEIIQNIPELMKVYPNPARSNINIQLELNELNSVEFRLYKLSGEIIEHQTRNNFQPGLNTFSINTNGISNGIYMLKCKSGNKTFSQKVLITK
ncbi:MAG: T9SS type A sorting domain-containing protein, partial [Bacteroidales bacterium]|nr:T9SS type A sorting domain-containing protein [Bacteroidales bacterium]